MRQLTESQLSTLVSEVKKHAEIEGEEHDTRLQNKLPGMVGAVEETYKVRLNMNNPPDSLILYLADSIVQEAVQAEQGNLKTKKMGDVTFTYLTPSEAPNAARSHLRALKKVRTI